MIFVQRANVPRPQWFGSTAWGAAQTALQKHVSADAPSRAQKRSTTITGQFPTEVIDALYRVFDGRCAMCESKVGTKSLSYVKRFRPLEVEGGKTREERYAYSFAALLWENLILLCAACDRARGDVFPLLVAAPPAPQKPLNPARPRSCRRFYDTLEKQLAQLRSSEQPKVIDPTFDQPAEFLSFHAAGKVEPVKTNSVNHATRARFTIECFQLGRTDLLAGRRKAAGSIAKALKSARLSKTGKNPTPAAAAINAAHSQLAPAVQLLGGEFQAAKAFTFVRWLRTRVEAPLGDILPLLQWPKGELDDARRVLLPIWQNVERGGRIKVKRPGAGTAKATEPGEPSPSPTTPNITRQRLTNVVLENFRHFTSATFSIPAVQPPDAMGTGRKLRELIAAAASKSLEPDPVACGWKMLLGENGVGKSSVLQAIAAALTADQFGVDALKQIYHCDMTHSLPPGVTQGSIELTLEDPPKQIRLTFTRKQVEVQPPPKAAIENAAAAAPSMVFLRGYGATRLLPPKPSENEGSNPNASAPRLPDPLPQDVRNLFNPFHALADAEAWLKLLDSESQYQAFLTLKDLLDLPDAANLKFGTWLGTSTFGLDYKGMFTPLEHFSAGYQSVIALACDIMAGFGTNVGNMRTRTGIVLLDEIGTNLHPAWRLRIVGALRRAFPELQFIASTHEPLCLRGLGEKEVALLKLDDGTDSAGAANATGKPRRPVNRPHVVVRDDLPSPAFFRVDQLLTGDFFGLCSAYDPDEEAAYRVYYDLLVEERSAQNFPPEKAQLLNELQGMLKGRLVLGDTAAERRVMAALEEAEIEQAKSKQEPIKASKEAEDAARRLLRTIIPQK